MAALAPIPVLLEAVPVGPLSAQLRCQRRDLHVRFTSTPAVRFAQTLAIPSDLGLFLRADGRTCVSEPNLIPSQRALTACDYLSMNSNLCSSTSTDHHPLRQTRPSTSSPPSSRRNRLLLVMSSTRTRPTPQVYAGWVHIVRCSNAVRRDVGIDRRGRISCSQSID